MSRFDEAVTDLAAAQHLDKEARLATETKCTDVVYETQSEILDLLVKHVAELGEVRFDFNVAYVDLVLQGRGLG